MTHLKLLIYIPLALAVLSCSTFVGMNSRLTSLYSGSGKSSARSNRLDFTSEYSNLDINFMVTGNAVITWYYADGTTDIGSYSHSNFVSNAHRAHYVTIDPPEALIYIDASRSDSGISSITGLSNFPNLYFIYCYENTSLTNLCLANCRSVNQLHLDSTGVSKSDVDQWLIDIDNSTGDVSHVVADFYYSARTHASDQAYSNLVSKGWSMYDSGY